MRMRVLKRETEGGPGLSPAVLPLLCSRVDGSSEGACAMLERYCSAGWRLPGAVVSTVQRYGRFTAQS